MAVEDVSEKPASRTYTRDAKNVRTYQRTFIVLTDGTDGPAEVESFVLTELGWAASLNNTYNIGTESDATAKSNNIQVNEVSTDKKQWEVVISYGKLEFVSPLDEPAKVSWSFQPYTRIIDKDNAGNPIRSSNGLPFIEGVEFEDNQLVLTVTENAASFDSATAYQYRNATNSDVYRGAPVGSLKVLSPSVQQEYDQQIGYWYRISWSFLHHPQGWAKEILNTGLYQLDGTNFLPININGQPATEPHMLDGTGALLPQGGTPTYTTANIYPSLTFSVFP